MSEDSQTYQIFPDLTEQEYEALKADIAERGVQVPIEYDEDGNVLDGHHRVRICGELDIEDWPSIIRCDMSEDEKVEHILELNLARRHLTREQRREVVAKLRGEGWSFRRIGDRLGVDDRTARRDWDHAGAANAAPDEPATVTGADGKHYPARKPTTVAKDAEEREEATDLLSGVEDKPEGIADVTDLKRQRTRENKQRQKVQAEEHRRKAAEEIDGRDIPVIVGDFRENADRVPDGSLSLIFTDPPYDRRASEILPDLGAFAAEKLAEGGSLLCYVGQTQLPSAMDALRGSLRYWWIINCTFSEGHTLMREYGIKAQWKPVLWFVKGSRGDKTTLVKDMISGGREKDSHEWQQSIAEAQYWIDALCPPDGVICDPYLGTGTTALAAEKLNRQWIGFEKDAEQVETIVARLSAHELS